MIVRRNPGLALYTATERLPGVLRMHRKPQPDDREYDQPVREWPTDEDRRSWCFRTTPDTSAYAPAEAVGGYHRPYAGPHMWVSEPEQAEQSLELTWPAPVTIRSVDLVFDDDVHDDLINLHHHRTDYDVPPELVRAFHIEARTADTWHTLTQVTNNRRRHRAFALPEPVHAQALRIVIEATHGAPRAHVVSLRAYG
ncbi:hypothetical protein [Streptomyces sp. NPDC001508]|uniref:hypothetical protein n=1 Tax=Streptomyces sp. NPDC001508 TaxID=3154656 RepID=UPI00332E7508